MTKAPKKSALKIAPTAPAPAIKSTGEDVKSLLAQLGGELLPDNATHTCRVEFAGSSGNLYIASKRKNGGLECGCPAWKFRRDCKHSRAMKDGMEKLVKKLEG